MLLYNVPRSRCHIRFSYDVPFVKLTERAMILTVFLLVCSVNCLLAQEFNNSVLVQPPWQLSDCPAPYNGTNKTHVCPMCDSLGNCTVYVVVILPYSDHYVVNRERVRASLHNQFFSEHTYFLFDLI